MNTNLIIGLVVAAAVVGGGAYVYTQGSASTNMESTTEATGSLKDLMARGSSKCTVTNKVANSESTGVVYVGNGKLRGDFTTVTTNPAMTIESHMVSDGEFIYTWSDAMPQGVKLSVASAEGAQAEAAGTASLYGAQVGYDCDSWSVDASVFTVPTNVEFMDMSSMMQGAMQGVPGASDASVKAGAGASVQGGGASGSAGADVSANAQMCAACDMAPEPQKSQCKAALKCK